MENLHLDTCSLALQVFCFILQVMASKLWFVLHEWGQAIILRTILTAFFSCRLNSLSSESSMGNCPAWHLCVGHSVWKLLSLTPPILYSEGPHPIGNMWNLHVCFSFLWEAGEQRGQKKDPTPLAIKQCWQNHSNASAFSLTGPFSKSMETELLVYLPLPSWTFVSETS